MASQGVARAEAVGWRQGQRVTRHRTVERARPTNGAPRRRCRLTTSRASHETLASAIGRTVGSRALSESRRPSPRIARRWLTQGVHSEAWMFGRSARRTSPTSIRACVAWDARPPPALSTCACWEHVFRPPSHTDSPNRTRLGNCRRAQKPRPESKEAAYFENSELPRLFAQPHRRALQDVVPRRAEDRHAPRGVDRVAMG